MKTNLLVVFLFALAGNYFPESPRAEVHRSNTQIIDFILDFQEKRLLDVAEVMPAEKYAFVPSGGQFTGVRTFAEQLKHVASDNYLLGAGILAEKPPRDPGVDESGANSVQTKDEIIAYLKDSLRICIAPQRRSMKKSVLFPLRPSRPGRKGQRRVWV
jgi:hypothetical protein